MRKSICLLPLKSPSLLPAYTGLYILLQGSLMLRGADGQDMKRVPRYTMIGMQGSGGSTTTFTRGKYRELWYPFLDCLALVAIF